VALAALFAFLGRAPAAEDQARASTVCLDCHTGRDSTLAGTAHWAGTVHDGAAAVVACTDCHGSNSKHWEEDPAANPMTNPSKVGVTAEARICSRCHQDSHQQNMLEKNVHPANDVSCSGCHSVHGSMHDPLLKAAEPQLCESCHPRAGMQFAQPYRHPVAEGIVKCTDCHMTLDKTSRPLSSNGTSVCLDCHAEFAGPFPFEHAATLGHSTEEGGCLSCHEPHGSSLPRMVKQPYEPPHYPLCTQCHGVPAGHLSNTMHGTRWAAVPCNDCHSDIHGSYDNRLFLNQSFVAQGCLTPGCHGN
jgi:DmsE family decaheme c-type cytochrome